MRVAVMGQGERADAHRDWYRRVGVAVLPAPTVGDEPPLADLYDLCGSVEECSRAAGVLLRRRRLAVLVGGDLAARPGEAARVARAAARRRTAVAAVGGWRWVPAFARLRELVAGGTLGTIRSVEVQVTAPRQRMPEVLFGALDLGLWLAGDGTPVADSAIPAAVRFRAGEAEVMVQVAEDSGETEPGWAVSLAADLGQAAAQASFLPGLPGRDCHSQSASVTRSGRQRALPVPHADPVASELAAVLARQRAGQPWLALCLADRAATLAALLAAPPADPAAKPSSSG